MDYFLNNVTIVDNQDCDSNTCPIIKVRCEKRSNDVFEYTDIEICFENKNIFVLNLPLCGPIQVLKTIDTNGLYRFKLKNTKTGKVRIFEIEELEKVDVELPIHDEDVPIHDEDVPLPDDYDKAIIAKELLKTIENRITMYEGEILHLKDMKSQISHNKKDISLIEGIYNELNGLI
jgi:hypothetical protein